MDISSIFASNKGKKMSKKTCRECGKDSANDARFCGYCGKAFPAISLINLVPRPLMNFNFFEDEEEEIEVPKGASGVEIDPEYEKLLKALSGWWSLEGVIKEREEEVEVEVEEPPPPEVIPVKIVSPDWMWVVGIIIIIFLGAGYVLFSSERVARFIVPPSNLVLPEPRYQGSVNNIFRDGRRLWWQSGYFACVAVFGEDVGSTFIPGRLIRQGEWRGWQFAELRGEGDRYLFLSVCGAGWNTYISEIPPDVPEHLGQAVVQDGIRAYRVAPP
jgi:hypothetical protein